MPRYGFTGDEPDMRKLILYILKTLDEPACDRDLTSLALLDDNADYFCYSDAFAGLLETGMTERRDGFTALTVRGAEIAAITETELPSALRRACAEACAAVRDKNNRDRCVTSSIESDGGAVYFAGTLSDGGPPLLTLRIQTGGEKQAMMLKKRFDKDAEVILARIWEVMAP